MIEYLCIMPLIFSSIQIPSKLLLQVPQFRMKFKAGKKIIPDLKLNISEITDSGN